jgi:hypothetical protein
MSRSLSLLCSVPEIKDYCISLYLDQFRKGGFSSELCAKIVRDGWGAKSVSSVLSGLLYPWQSPELP